MKEGLVIIIYIVSVFLLGFILGGTMCATISRQETIQAINGELQYDTLSMDKYGKVLEIKVID